MNIPRVECHQSTDQRYSFRKLQLNTTVSCSEFTEGRVDIPVAVHHHLVAGLVPDVHGQAMTVCIVAVKFGKLGVLNTEMSRTVAVGCVLVPEQPQGDSGFQEFLADVAVVRHLSRSAQHLV